MNQKIAQTTELWQGSTLPEQGNLASVGNLQHAGADYGIVARVDFLTVTVNWYQSNRTRRASRENKGHQAARRVVAAYELDAALNN